MTPSFIGLMATMFPGVRPNISLASLPTASTSPVFLFSATIDGSLTTMPLPRAYTSVLAVPRSMARSLENMLNKERRLWDRDVPLWNPLFDMEELLSLRTYTPHKRLRSMDDPEASAQVSVPVPLFYLHISRNSISPVLPLPEISIFTG